MSIDSNATAGDERPLASPTVRQFVTFLVAHETYAVPLAEVQEIIRLPEMVGVPLSPAALAGLANLRGAVLPIASLRRIFALPDHDDATRVVIISQETPFGFVVDRMSSVVTCELGDIDGTEGLQATVDTDMLSGIIRRPDGMIMIIDAARLMQPSAGTRPVRGSERVETLADAGSTRSAETVSDEIQLVSFELAGQEYALPIEHVQEIVQVPATVNAVPKADPSVVGVINLRDRLLPLVSLRLLFGLDDPGLSEHSRIVVVSWSGAGVARSVGIVTDTVKEVLRVSRSIADPVPELLSGGGALREVEAICRINNGNTGPTPLTPGTVYIGRGDADVVIERKLGRFIVNSVPADPTLRWHPSVERLVRTAGTVFPAEGLVAVQLTGMGNDGAAEMAALHRSGGRTIAESQETAVVFGMPAELIKLGGATVTLPAGAIPAQLLTWLS